MHTRMWPWLVFALAAAVYANTIGHGFVLDDKAIITENKLTQMGFSGIVEHFSHSYWYGIKGENAGNYRPLTGAIFSTMVGLFGSTPLPFHLLQIVCFAALCALICQFLITEASLPLAAAVASSLLFAVHPIHTEVVANVKSLDEILALLFSLLACWLSLRFLARPSALLAVGSAAFMFAACLSKETAIMIWPSIAVVLAGRADSVSAAARSLLPTFISLIAFIALYFSVTTVLGAEGYHLFDNSFVQSANAISISATKLSLLWHYAALLVWPASLVYDYSFNTIALVGLTHYTVVLSAVIILALGFWLWTSLRQSKPELYGHLALFALLVLPMLPVLNWFFPIGATMAERFLFAPSLAFCAVCGFGFTRFTNKFKASKLILYAGGVALMVVAASQTIARNAEWASEEELFATDLKKLPNSAKAHHNLANVYHQKGKTASGAAQTTYYESAIALLEQAAAIYPVQEFYRQLIELYGALGKWDGVVACANKFLALNAHDADVLSKRGLAHAIQGQVEKALPDFEQAHALAPHNREVGLNLAKTFAATGQMNKGFEVLEGLKPWPEGSEANSFLELWSDASRETDVAGAPAE